MMIGQTGLLSKSRIAGAVTCCPESKIDNNAFLDRFASEDIDNIQRLSGVNHRYWVCDGQSGLDLSVSAAERLLAGIQWRPEDIDALIYVTQSPENILPATSIRMAHSIGLRAGIVAFDINLGCSGYPYGLYVLMSMIETGLIRKGLLVATETPSKIIDQYDKSTAMLFGDGGSVTALEYSEGSLSHFVLGSDGSGADNLVIPNCRFSSNKMTHDERLKGRNPDYLYMDGPEIFNFTLKRVPALVTESVKQASVVPDTYLFHQANSFMLEHLRKKMKLLVEEVPMNIAEYGNTSVASIPLLLTTKVSERIKAHGMTSVGMFGFGVGYSWSSCITNLDAGIYLEHFHDS